MGMEHVIPQLTNKILNEVKKGKSKKVNIELIGNGNDKSI